MAIECDATSTPLKRVASPSRISLYVGNPPRELLIFSGVALPDWDSRSNLDYADVVVILAGPTTRFFQYTSTVSLASITNTDSDFIFAADESSVVNGGSGLELHVRIGVQGDMSLLSCFSYHVQVLSDPITAKVTGNIRWSQGLSDPTEAAKHLATSMFRVAAGAMVFDPSAPGLGGSGGWVWAERVSTFTTEAPILAGGTWAVPYVLENVPLDEQLQVIPALLDGALVSPPKPAVFTPNPRYVHLTPARP